MKKPIENFIIIGDGLSKEPNFKEVYLEDNELSSLERLILNKFPVWHEALLDRIFYIANNLPSSFSCVHLSRFRKEYNLQHYVVDYIYDRVRVVAGEPEISRRSARKIHSVDLTYICQDIASLRKRNIAKNSLVVFFIGADDITGHSPDVCSLVVQYIEKLNLLIGAGYINFVIIDIPNIFPDEFIAKIGVFNTTLNTQIGLMRQSNPSVTIDILNSTSSFSGLSCFCKQDSEIKNFNLSREAHVALANSFYISIFASKYEFVLPRPILLELFRTRYSDIIARNKASHFSWFYTKPWDKYESASLREIFAHSDVRQNNRTFKVLRALGWVNQHGDCISTNPIIIRDATYVNPRIASIN